MSVKQVVILLAILLIGCKKESKPTQGSTPCQTDFVGVWETTDPCQKILDIAYVNDNYVIINNNVNAFVSCGEFFGVYQPSGAELTGTYVNDTTISVSLRINGSSCDAVYYRIH